MSPLTAIILLVSASCVLGVQKICVKGKLTCPGKPGNVANIDIKLMDDNTFRPDETMKRGKTNKDGTFEICGESNDLLGSIDPELRIFTRCNNGIRPCKREITKKINKKFIGKTAEILMDLESKFDSESQDCIN